MYQYANLMFIYGICVMVCVFLALEIENWDFKYLQPSCTCLSLTYSGPR